MKTTFSPGSYDPGSRGHQGINQVFAKDADRHIVPIATNPDKHYRFSRQERKHIMELLLADQLFENGGNVEVTYSDTIAYRDMIRAYGTNVQPKKGVRHDGDRKYEKPIHDISMTQLPKGDRDILNQLDLVQSPQAIAGFSSSLIRALCAAGGKIYSPEEAYRYVTLLTKPYIEQRLKGQILVGMTGVSGSGKSYIASKVVEIGKKMGLEVHHLDLDKVWHFIIGDSSAEYHIEIRQQVMDWLEKCEQEDGKEYGEYINNVFTDEGFIKQEGRTFIRNNIVFINPEQKDRLNQLTAIAWPAIDLEVDIKTATMKGLIILNNAIIAENNTSYKTNNNTVLVSSDLQHTQLQNRENIDSDDAKKYTKFQEGTEKKRVLLQATIDTDHAGNIIEFQNNMAGEPEIKKLIHQMLQVADKDCSKRFEALLTRVCPHLSDTQKLQAYELIKGQHDTPERAYHAWQHMITMWNELYAIADQLSDEELAVYEFAIMFHDIRMKFAKEPGYVDEERSAEYARDIMIQRGVPKDIMRQVVAVIMRSKHSIHEMPQNFVEAHFVANDLDVLSWDFKKYWKYTQQVREEYGHFGDNVFKQGRIVFLKKMLEKEHIMPVQYYKTLQKNDPRITPAIVARLEEKDKQAKINVQQELAILSAEKSALTGDKSPTVCMLEHQEDEGGKLVKMSKFSIPEGIMKERNKVTITEKRSFYLNVPKHYDMKVIKRSKYHYSGLEKCLREYFSENDNARQWLLSTQGGVLQHMDEGAEYSVCPGVLIKILLFLRDELRWL